MAIDQSSEWAIPSWQGRSNGMRVLRHFEHMGVKTCYICADERVGELRSEIRGL